jgi:hypothetical protein
VAEELIADIHSGDGDEIGIVYPDGSPSPKTMEEESPRAQILGGQAA